MNVQKAGSIGDFIKNALKDSSHTAIPNVSADKGIWHVVTHFNGIFYLFFAIDDRPNVNLFTSSDGYVFEEHENFKDKFRMYYLSSKSGTYLAISEDGISWENSPINPVFDEGALATFIPLEDILIAFYLSSSATSIAYSEDGVRWIDYAKKNPVLSPNMMPYDCKRIVWPYAVQMDEGLYLYYQIVDSKGKWKLAVTSINLRNVLNKV